MNISEYEKENLDSEMIKLQACKKAYKNLYDEEFDIYEEQELREEVRDARE